MASRKIQTPGETQAVTSTEAQVEDTQAVIDTQSGGDVQVSGLGIDVKPEPTKPTYEELEAQVERLTHENMAYEVAFENMQKTQAIEPIAAKTPAPEKPTTPVLTDKGWIC